MILFQTVSAVLHDVETEVHKDDMANPFPMSTEDRCIDLQSMIKDVISENDVVGTPFRHSLLATAAAIVRLVAQMDIENHKKEKK